MIASIKIDFSSRYSERRYEKQSQFLLLHDPHRFSDCVIFILVIGGSHFHSQSSCVRGMIYSRIFFLYNFISFSLRSFRGILFSLFFWCFSIQSFFCTRKSSICEIDNRIGERTMSVPISLIWIESVRLLLRMSEYGICMKWTILNYMNFSIKKSRNPCYILISIGYPYSEDHSFLILFLSWNCFLRFLFCFSRFIVFSYQIVFMQLTHFWHQLFLLNHFKN